ncbi:hypothetical protein [Sphingomonas sp.]|jgi:hypothetical protein|uniref:hypothetical protein n=1 Tax=Sphingomonas sp. TaxID=28214 RepID=UPI002602C8FF|nr:hypothetical protein [Sphingomonas sp.]MDF2496004.1 hypothetical protein [Sphingomonas sp.]
MDLNYLLGREQHALHMAATSLSSSARMAHRAFAKAYGVIIAESGFPHRDSIAQRGLVAPQSSARESQARINDWESEGGSVSPGAKSRDRLAIQQHTKHAEVPQS